MFFTKELRGRFWLYITTLLLSMSGQQTWGASAAGPSVNIDPAVAISLQTDPARHYILQSTPTLDNPAWYDVSPIFNGDGSVLSLFQRTTGAASGYFRVVEHDIDAGLVAHYPLDGNANDVSAYENDGIVLGAAPSKDRFGNPYGAYRFSGTNHMILMPHEQQQTLTTGDFTVAYWVNFEAQNSVAHIMGKSDGPGNTSKWIIRHDNSVGSFTLDLNSIGENASVGTAGAWHFSSNVWTHVTHTLTSNIYRTYINGRLASESQGPVLTATSSAILSIGQVENVGWLQGSLDDIRMYNRALAPMEIKALYAYNPVKLGLGLVAHFNFNESPQLESVFGQHATATDIELVPDRFGRPASAANFNGASRLELADTPAVKALNTELTISFWAQFQGTAGERHIIGRSNGSGAQKKWLWLYRTGPSALSFLINNQPTEVNAIRTTWPHSTNNWYHFVLTKSGSTYVTYINGLKAAQTSGLSVLPTVAAPLRVGDLEGSNRFVGKLDDLRIYERALSEKEVQALGELVD